MNLPEEFHQEVIEARKNARKKVSTYLLYRGGPSFETHSLHKTRRNNLCFKLSTRLGFETIILFGLPLAYIVFILYKYSTTGSFKFLLNNSIYYFIFAYICITLLSSLFGNLRHYTFSKSANFYFTGFPLLPAQLAYTKYKLDEIIAIQVLGENLIVENSIAMQKVLS